MIQAVLSNPSHPEYGVATIPFPIPRDQYAHCMELLEALEIGNALKADCKVEEIDSFYTVLKRAEMLTVNVEELNYLAKRLDSFDTGEAAQFQAMAHKLELFELKDLINLTFCCQQATVITDFSDLAAVGRDHYMNLHGGSASVDELNALDGKGTARQLIESGSGTVTPYGVVYDNGMKLEQVYPCSTGAGSAASGRCADHDGIIQTILLCAAAQKDGRCDQPRDSGTAAAGQRLYRSPSGRSGTIGAACDLF